MRIILKILQCVAIFSMSIVLPNCSSCGAPTDKSANYPLQKIIKDADKVEQLILQNKTAEAVSVCAKALTAIGEILPLPAGASPEQQSDFQAKRDYVSYFAATAFQTLRNDDDYNAAIPFAERIIRIAEVQGESGFESKNIKTSWILEVVDSVGNHYTDVNQPEMAIDIYNRGIAYAHKRTAKKLDSLTSWYLGRVYTSLAYNLWEIPVYRVAQYVSSKVYVTGIDYLLKGVASQLENPEEMYELFPEFIFVALEQTADYDSYMKRAISYTTRDLYMKRAIYYTNRLKAYNHPAVDVVLASVYAYVAYNEYDFKTVQSAVEWNTKAIGKLNFETDKTTASLNVLVQQATFLITAGDVAGAKNQLDRLKELTLGVSDSTVGITVRGWIAAVEADLHFMAMDAESMLRSWEAILSLKDLSADNPDLIWNQVNTLLSVASYHDDADVAVEMLNRADTVLTGMKSQGAFEDDVYWLRQYSALTKFDLYGLYWFDSEFTYSVIEDTPQNLEEVSLNQMFVMLEFEYLKGDRHTCERLVTEMLMRGVSESNLTATFWAFNYGE